MVKICPKCGLEYPDADSFCIECGGRLRVMAIPKPAKIPESVRLQGKKLIQEIRKEALKDVQKNTKNIQILKNRVTMLSGLEKDLAEAILRLKETEAIQKGRIGKLKEQEEGNKKHINDMEKLTEDLILQQQHRLASLESRIEKALDNLRVYSRGISGDVEVKLIKRLGLNLRKVNELRRRINRLVALEKSMEMHIKKNKELSEDLILQQQSRIAALESRIAESLGEVKKEGSRGIFELEKELEAVKKTELVKISQRVEGVEASGLDSKQQLDLMKEFMENLEKRVRLETSNLDGRLDVISKIQEKQELEILTPKRENINRIIKTQIKNEMRSLEERISRNILKKMR